MSVLLHIVPLFVVVLGVVACGFVLCADSSERVSVNFNYGWRFRFGHAPDGQEGPSPCGFEPISSKPLVCNGINNNPNRFAIGDCAEACCYNPDCYLWTIVGKTCWHGGKNASCVENEKGRAYDGTGVRTSVSPIRTDYEFAKADVNDTTWDIVDAPHDFLITNSYFSPLANMKHGHIMRNVSWYTKHFHLPEEFSGSNVYIHFEGIFHVAQIWVNGEYQMMHTSGYTGFTLRLDNITSIVYGQDKENIINIRADATFGSGHWYEGGGIYRPVHLVSVPKQAHIVHDGLFVECESDGTTVSASVELESFNSDADVPLVLEYVVREQGVDDIVASGTQNVTVTPKSGTKIQKITLTPSQSPLQTWGIETPNMYNVTVYVTDPNNGNTVYDSVSATVGFRRTMWSGQTGFHMNGRHIKFRGFSNHNSFAGVGVAMAPRLNLFRVQSLRALGGNIWRMSHNPYVPHLYNLLNNLGVLVWDENRDYGLEYIPEMHDMVKRDRNHPSIVVWGFCNEVECNQATNATGLGYRKAAKSLDPTRPTAANDFTYGIDVQGWSHANANKFIQSHEKKPDQPLVLSECCSCQSQRIGDRSVGTCEENQNSPGLLPYVTGSLGVWTLMDYFGEPAGSWPFVSCSYGQFDLAGFPKPHAYWYHVNWLAMFNPLNSTGRPALAAVNVSRVLSSASSIVSSATLNKDLTVHTITNSMTSELFVNDVSVGSQSNTSGVDTTWSFAPPAPTHNCTCDLPIVANVQCRGLSSADANTAEKCKTLCCADPYCSIWQFLGSQKEACWIGTYDASKCYNGTSGPWIGEATLNRNCVVPFNNITVVGRTGGEVDSSHTIYYPSMNSTTYQLSMNVDVPSPATGTGPMLAFDGLDTALIAVSLVDNSGVLVASSSPLNVTFFIISGPGRITGSGNGNPKSLQLPYVNTKELYGGMARVSVQVTHDCISAHRELSSQIDVDGGHRTSLSCEGFGSDPVPIVVGVSVAGFPHLSSNVTVLATTDISHTVSQFVQTDEAHHPSYTYLKDFQG
eukprot:m.175817 g.175817  ORF g.175817 m.175817 type:complete len:1026 (+) comp13521_c0_seq1:161-3238(+)